MALLQTANRVATCSGVGVDETTTTVTARDASGKEVATTSTTSGAAETVTVLRPPGGPEVTTTVKSGAAATPTGADADRYIAIWAKAVETQMHFNEMSVKSRQLGLTFVAAALGVAVVLMSQQKDYSIHVLNAFDLHVAVLLVLSAAGAIYLVSILDLGVYHRMLRGAVAFGEELEELQLKSYLGVEHGMTQAISLFSRYPETGFKLDASPRYQPSSKRITAEDKIRRFYRWTIGLLLFSAALLFSVTFNTSPQGGSPTAKPAHQQSSTSTSP